MRRIQQITESLYTKFAEQISKVSHGLHDSRAVLFKLCCCVYEILPCPISVALTKWLVSTRNQTEKTKPYSPDHHVTIQNFFNLQILFESHNFISHMDPDRTGSGLASA